MDRFGELNSKVRWDKPILLLNRALVKFGNIEQGMEVSQWAH
jgi:tRNA uridine 5-carbamoylmethylation protein Kti12